MGQNQHINRFVYLQCGGNSYQRNHDRLVRNEHSEEESWKYKCRSAETPLSKDEPVDRTDYR